jgi:membrane protease YdiL (CAAX protease family)
MLVSWLADAPAIVRVVAFFGIWLGLWLPIAAPLFIMLGWQPAQPIEMRQKLPLLASLYGVAPFVLWGAAWVEGVPFSSYGLTGRIAVLGSLGTGLGLGILGLAVLWGIQLCLGWIRWQPTHQDQFWQVLPPMLGLGVGVSLIEELIFRGFLLNQLLQDYSAWIAAAIASLIFALLHLIWEGRATIPQLPGLWLMGMVLVLARWVDGGSLGLAWGLHAGWVWGMVSLDSAPILVNTGKGATWITGLNQKPLAGLLGILLLLGTGVILWLFQN